MALPPYSQDVFWKEYEIDTPTFDLSPVEKPDMSPFLFHMTGRREIQAILQGDGVDEPIPAGHGFLRACVPEAGGDNYQAEVVCFTESPIFALDFFRYRSFRRWRDDVLYGVAFSKSRLVGLNVFPCLYASHTLKDRIIALFHQQDDNPFNEELPEHVQQLIAELYPLTTPLLELEPQQGFMWEREWRFTDPQGFTFPYEAIEVICCPASEVADIVGQLGEHAENVQFVESWQEYDEVTQFLRGRSRVATAPQELSAQQQKAALQTHQRLTHSLEIYKALAERLSRMIPRLQEEIENQNEAIEQLERNIDEETPDDGARL